MTHICGECKFHLIRDECPKAEYNDSKLNVAACLSSDTSCPLFQPKYNGKNAEDLDMKEALELLNENVFKCPTDSETLLVYEEGIYRKAKPLIWNILESEYGNKLKRSFVDEAYAHLQRANTIDRSEVNKQTNILPMQNGLFNLLTGDLTAFDPEQVFTYKLDIKYDPENMCPNWLEFIKEVVTEEDIPLLQEMMGYCLLAAIPFHKMFWLYGTGRNGKGVVIRTLEKVLGADSCGSLNLSEFREGRRFSLCQLYGKLINVSSEPPLSKYGLPTTVLKMVTGEDTIKAEMKGKNERLSFVNVSKLFIIGNHFPKVEDNSLGWWDRVIVLKFPYSFEGNKCIPNIEKNWIPEELSGVFNWMLEGLYRIRENNGFSSSKSTEETKAEFMKVSDPFNAWIIECCNMIPNAYITHEDAFTNYLEYCDELGADRDSKRGFYAKMRQVPKVKDVQKKVAGQSPRVFEGITLKIDGQIVLNDEKVTEVTEVTGFTHRVCGEVSNIGLVKTPVIPVTSVTNESVKLEWLRNWIKCEMIRTRQELTLDAVKAQIEKCGFMDCSGVLRRLSESGDLVGVCV